MSLGFANYIFTSPSTKNAGNFESPEVTIIKHIKEINEIGKSDQSFINCFRISNMQSMTQKTFERICEFMESASHALMNKTATEIMENKDKEIHHTGKTMYNVTLDSAWQKRGYSSMNGYVAALHQGKLIDVQV